MKRKISQMMRRKISQITKKNLAKLERSKQRAKNLLDRVIPFEVWCKTEPKSKFEKEMYWLIVNDLKKMAEEGDLTCLLLS